MKINKEKHFLINGKEKLTRTTHRGRTSSGAVGIPDDLCEGKLFTDRVQINEMLRPDDIISYQM